MSSKLGKPDGAKAAVPTIIASDEAAGAAPG
jgi:hypothetical protein